MYVTPAPHPVPVHYYVESIASQPLFDVLVLAATIALGVAGVRTLRQRRRTTELM